MNNLHPLIKKYYNQTKNKIPAFYPKKKEILSQIHSSLIQYQDEHSKVTYDDLIKDFGSPSEFADSLIEFDSPDGIRRKLYNTRKISLIVIGVIVLIILCTIFVLKSMGGYITTQIVTIEEESPLETETNTNNLNNN